MAHLPFDSLAAHANQQEHQCKLPRLRSFVICLSLFATSCVSINSETTQSMTDDQLCEYLGPAWITTASEKKAIIAEMGKRGLRCSNGWVVGYTNAAEAESVREPVSLPQSIIGSGFVVSPDGLIATNFHVAGKCEALAVVTRKGRVAARFVAGDQTNDMALIQAVGTGFSAPAKLRSSPPVRLGDSIIVVGFPLGDLLGSGMKANGGAISSLSGLRDDTRMFQIDAPIQSGSSGGPVLDSSGLVVGMVTSKLDEVAVLELTGSLSQNVNFAIKGTTLMAFLQSHGIDFKKETAGEALSMPDIVEEAGNYTLKVVCN